MIVGITSSIIGHDPSPCFGAHMSESQNREKDHQDLAEADRLEAGGFSSEIRT